MKRVFVSGVGAVTGYGWGVDYLWAGLLSGRTAIRRVERFDPSAHRTELAAEAPLDSAPPAADRRQSLADRYAVFAAREALAEAGLELPAPGLRVGVFFGSSTGGMLESERYYEKLLGQGEGPPRMTELVSQQYNGPGDAVARAVRADGPVESVSSACTSGAIAIGHALDSLRAGEIDIALAGGSDSLCQLTFAGFNALRSVDAAPTRPFRADRAGLTLGEGSGVLVLESEDSLARRNGRAGVELLAVGSTCDAHHMTAPHPEGRGARQAIEAAFEVGGVAPAEIGFINAHATGTPLNDLAEWKAIRAAFGPVAETIPITASKSCIGHLLGAAGAIEAVISVYALRAAILPPIPSGGDVDSGVTADLVFDEPRPLPGVRYGLSTNLAFGGSNTAVLLRLTGEAP